MRGCNRSSRSLHHTPHESGVHKEHEVLEECTHQVTRAVRSPGCAHQGAPLGVRKYLGVCCHMRAALGARAPMHGMRLFGRHALLGVSSASTRCVLLSPRSGVHF